MNALALSGLSLALLAAGASSAAAGRHTNNWAVVVGTSSFWFNYRHVSNALGVYRTLRRLGVPDSNVILMLADDMACNPRNAYGGQVYASEEHEPNLYGDHVEVDYRGAEVTVENFLRVLEGRHSDHVPRGKRLLSDESSNILVYLTGHGGDQFLKFQDAEELTSADLADAFQQMYEKGRYHEILFVSDTCQAATLSDRLFSPNVLTLACSRRGESSYSYRSDTDLGLSVIDRFTFHTLQFFEQRVARNSTATLGELMATYDYSKLHSNALLRTDLFGRPADRVLLTDFFGSPVPRDVVAADGSFWDGDSRAPAAAASAESSTRSLRELRDQRAGHEALAVPRERVGAQRGAARAPAAIDERAPFEQRVGLAAFAALVTSVALSLLR
eukprot:m51a1_g10834 putative phosphatidylinositol glycan (387) ;mRNA; f:43077-44697